MPGAPLGRHTTLLFREDSRARASRTTCIGTATFGSASQQHRFSWLRLWRDGGNQ